MLLSQLKKHSTGIFSLAACVLMAGGLATSPAFAAGDTPPDHRHTICHATGSEKNPFVEITPAKAGVVNGHSGNSHQSGDDIIPPFSHEKKGETIHHPGQNWGAQGQATFDAGCVPTEVTPPPTVEPPTIQPPTVEPPTVAPPTVVPPAVVPPAVTPDQVQPIGAAAARVPLGAAKAAPAQVSIAADTAAESGGADHTVSGALIGSGGLLMVWVLLTGYTRRLRRQHAD
jgi:hypothetical protein